MLNDLVRRLDAQNNNEFINNYRAYFDDIVRLKPVAPLMSEPQIIKSKEVCK